MVFRQQDPSRARLGVLTGRSLAFRGEESPHCSAPTRGDAPEESREGYYIIVSYFTMDKY